MNERTREILDLALVAAATNIAAVVTATAIAPLIAAELWQGYALGVVLSGLVVCANWIFYKAFRKS